MTAHRSFGARSGGAPVVLGAGLLAAAVGLGAALPELLARFPVTVLGALLGVAGVLHVTLLRDLGSNRDRAIALGVGAVGILGNLAVALVLGILAWWALERRTGRITR